MSELTTTRIARVLLPLGIALGALLISACDVPGPAVGAVLEDGTLKVLGTDGSESIALRLQSGNPNVIEVDVANDGAAEFHFDRPGVQQIVVKAFAGDDTIFVDQINGVFTDTIATTLFGGDDTDTLKGGVGAETLDGGTGDDFLDGNQGVDSLAGGDGDDTFQWDPGDTSDTVVGGTGGDELAFNGSNVSEDYDVAASGGHVRLFRNVASVVMDLDDVETIDLRTLGGTDTLTPHDLTGTDLTTFNTDFAATGGMDDAAVDEVRVGPGLPIGRDATAATIGGLGAQMRVLNGGSGDAIRATGTAGIDVVPVAGTSGTDTVSAVSDGSDVVVDGATPGVFIRVTAAENIDLDLLAGDDHFASTGNVAALTLLDVNGGDGADTLLGGNGTDVISGAGGADFLDGNQGSDTVLGGDGADAFEWDPGDASDMLLGGAGADTLAFNGSNTAEIFDVSATAGGHVRLTRNIASVMMDLDDIETVDLRTLGGADVLNPTDLTGTDMTVFNTDLAATGGVDDAAVDEVRVGPGLPIGRDATAATIGGLGAQMRVLNGGAGDAIRATGTPGVDVVPVVGTSGADTVSAVSDGSDVVVDGATPGVFVRVTTAETVDIDLVAGDDQFSSVGNVAALTTLDVDGGDGADTLLGGNGADLIAGGPGLDFLDGNQGTDTVTGGDGADVFQWDPGDNNDMLAGGADADRLAFNGSNAAEIFDVSAIAGGHVQLTRNVAAIVMDLDDIETVDLRTLGSTDVVNPHDLTGTDVTVFNTDLAATGGVDDAAVDEVKVGPGLPIGRDATAATIGGLGAQMRVLNGGAGDSIRATGTAAADVVPVVGTAGADLVSAVADGTDVVVDGATPGVFVRVTTAETVDIDLLAGDDQFSSTGNVAALTTLDVDGGEGADTIRGGNGADLLSGGVGDDFLDGNQGTDTVTGGDGADVFEWDPGDNNDVLTGGTGPDRLTFNGSNIGEIFDVSAVGGHVRFTRNIANVLLDVDDIETLDVRTLSGADVITANDLTGTDLTAVNTDLAATGGVDDLQVDQVIVNGSPGDDSIGVVDDGAAVVVQGLAATVRIAGAAPTADSLTVQGLAGNDTITAAPGAGALILLNLVP